MALFNPINLVRRSTSATSFDVDASVTSTSLLAANFNRVGAVIWNNSTSDLYVDFDSSVSLTSFSVKISPDGYYELPFNYVGVISGIWESEDGKAIIREFIE
jgi:hypothetical protein